MSKKCVLNVAIGGRYPREQKVLVKSLEGKFDGDVVTWGEFPNQNYNTKNRYNCKAAAFEEAIGRGYTQLLWLDTPAVVIRPLQPVFDMMQELGYYTLNSGRSNCAMTCSDACLSYYGVSRDTAETFPEHASGVMGVDIEHPMGKKLIDMFMLGCKEGACEGSRFHDNQSQDPRFLYHRQDQSVLSMSANLLGLPYADVWTKGYVTKYAEHVTDKTIICWRYPMPTAPSNADAAR